MNQKQVDELIDAYHSGDSDKINLLLSTSDDNLFPGSHEIYVLVPRALNRDELFIEWFCRAWKDDTDTLSKILRWDDLSESDKKPIAEVWEEFSRTWCGDNRVDWCVITSSSNVSAVIARCVPSRHQYEAWLGMYKNATELREVLERDWYLIED